jgi:hypothetical protein
MKDKTASREVESLEQSVTFLQANLSSWIIQDGNYGDFDIGDIIRCALEFWWNDLHPSSQHEFRAVHLIDDVYQVCGKIIYSNSHVFVIDIGIKAYCECSPPDFATEGVWFEGKVSFGIDPFFYKEYLSREEGIPDIFYEWNVRRIELNNTPWIENRSLRTRDETRKNWSDVKATDAWNDDNGNAEYILHLQKI